MPQSPYPMIPFDQAFALVLDNVNPKSPRHQAFDQALGLTLAEAVTATEPTPPFAAASVDGYALQSTDDGPRRIVGDQAAGYIAQVRITPGTAARVTTGAPVPPGADAVVMVEETEVQGDTLLVQQIPPAGANIRPVGQDMQPGQLVLPEGAVIGPPEMGLLAMLRKTTVSVYPPVTVGIMSTGDELVAPHQSLAPGQIRDANRFALMAEVRQLGCQVVDLGIVRDKTGQLEATIERGLAQADVLLTSGGVSMGQLDLVKPYLAEHGQILFGRVRTKPGKPVTFALLQGKPFFALPGFPVSALVSFENFVRPALLKMMGRQHFNRPRRTVTLTQAVKHNAERTEFQRAIITRNPDGTLLAEPAGFQGSARLLSLHLANGLILLPHGQGDFSAGAQVEAILFETLP